jgi:hypothetical protein
MVNLHNIKLDEREIGVQLQYKSKVLSLFTIATLLIIVGNIIILTPGTFNMPTSIYIPYGYSVIPLLLVFCISPIICFKYNAKQSVNNIIMGMIAAMLIPMTLFDSIITNNNIAIIILILVSFLISILIYIVYVLAFNAYNKHFLAE